MLLLERDILLYSNCYLFILIKVLGNENFSTLLDFVFLGFLA